MHKGNGVIKRQVNQLVENLLTRGLGTLVNNRGVTVTANGNIGYLTDLDIRLYMRDNDPANNTLLDDFEYTPEELRTAMTHVVDRWNDTPPLMEGYSYTIDSFPFRSALLKGTCANLLFMAAMRFRRNSLQYSVPGGTVADQEKFAQYDDAGQRMWVEYLQWLQHAKRAVNMEQGFAIVDSMSTKPSVTTCCR